MAEAPDLPKKQAVEANIDTDMTFDPKALLSVGCDGLDVIDTSKCTVEGADTKVEVNKPAELTLHLVDSTGSPYIGLPSIVAEVKSLVDGSVIAATISPIGGGTYRAVFTPHVRGRHFVTVSVNGREICGSPFSVFVRVPPAQLEELPVRYIDRMEVPWGVAISKDEEVLVVEQYVGRVSVFDKQGRKLRTIQHNDLPHPRGVATDADGIIYISNSKDTVVKFSRDGQPLQVKKRLGPNLQLMQVISDTLFICNEEHVLLVACEDLHLIKRFGKKGKGKGEFDGSHQVVFVNGELYITDYNNHRIQVFGQEGLTFVRSFEVKDPSTQKLCCPGGICLGPDGLLYVVCSAPGCFSCVLVLALSGECEACLGGVGVWPVPLGVTVLSLPVAVAVDVDGFVYVSCCFNQKIFVY